MTQQSQPSAARTTPRITPEDIISLILDEMQAASAPSHYSHLVPNVFDVYLYAEDLDRLRPLIGRMRDEATRALSSKIAELNKSAAGLKLPLLKDRAPTQTV